MRARRPSSGSLVRLRLPKQANAEARALEMRAKPLPSVTQRDGTKITPRFCTRHIPAFDIPKPAEQPYRMLNFSATPAVYSESSLCFRSPRAEQRTCSVLSTLVIDFLARHGATIGRQSRTTTSVFIAVVADQPRIELLVLRARQRQSRDEAQRRGHHGRRALGDWNHRDCQTNHCDRRSKQQGEAQFRLEQQGGSHPRGTITTFIGSNRTADPRLPPLNRDRPRGK